MLTLSILLRIPKHLWVKVSPERGSNVEGLRLAVAAGASARFSVEAFAFVLPHRGQGEGRIVTP